MFALSRHLGEHPTEVANLVGLWLAHLTLSTIEEMVQQPKCPNLYWALTDLPAPLVDLRKGVHGEQTMVAAEFRAIRDDSPMTEQELEALVSRLSGVISFSREQTGQAPRSVRTALRTSTRDPKSLDAARERLIQSGGKKEMLAKFPPLQIILLDQKQRYALERDERLKLLAVPVWQTTGSIAAGKLQGGARWPLADLLPNIDKLRAEEAELERQLALLRWVEALRLFAGGHDGKLPASRDEIAVPLPMDPVTGKVVRLFPSTGRRATFAVNHLRDAGRARARVFTTA